MTLPPLTHIIGRTLGYAIIAVLLPLLSLAFIISAIVTAATWACQWGRTGSGIDRSLPPRSKRRSTMILKETPAVKACEQIHIGSLLHSVEHTEVGEHRCRPAQIAFH